MDENTELRIILEHYFNDTHFTECLLNDNCTETGGSGNDTTLSAASVGLSPSPLPQYFFILVILIYIIIFLAGVLGNSLVIFVVTRFPGLHTVTNTYILNLAIADMCFLLGLPLLISTMILKEWPFSSAVCTLYLATTSINQITSSLFLMVLSADRYIAVCHPITAPGLRTPTICRLVTSLTWVTSAIIMTPVFLYSRTVTNPVTGASSCNIVWTLDSTLLVGDVWSFIDNHTVFTVYSFIFGFAGPCLLIFLFYGLVVGQLWCCGPGVSVRIRSPSQQRLQRKVTRLILTIITVYLLCWLPHWAVQLLLMFGPPGLLSPPSTMLLVLVTSCLQYSNSAINPLLYSFLSDHFRKSFRDTCLGACLATRGSRDQSLLRQRDLTFTTRRTRRGPRFTAVLQEDTSRSPLPDPSSVMTSVSRVPASPTSPGPRAAPNTLTVISGRLAPPSIR